MSGGGSKKEKSDAVNMKQLWSDLARVEASHDYERGLKICNRILKLSQNEQLAIRSKAVCLIQMNKFEEALQCIKKYPTMADDFRLEKAYCEYRLNRPSEALATLGPSPEDIREQELLAQLLYRQEDYAQCLDIYKDLLRNTQDSYEEERQINLLAVLGNLKNATDFTDEIEYDKSYELCYNQACRVLSVGRHKEGERLLKQAESLCASTVDEEELLEESALIRNQRAFALQCVGRKEEATQIYTDILKQKPEDVTLVAVASNNLAALKGDQNLWESRKKMKVCQTKEVQQKLTKAQKESILRNNCLLNFHSNQLEACRAGIRDLRDKYNAKETAVLLSASLALRERKMDQAISALESCMASDHSMEVALALAQLYLSDGEVDKGIALLRSLVHLPAVLALCVSAYVAEGKTSEAVSLLQAQLNKLKKGEDTMKRCIQEDLAKLCIDAGDYPAATRHLEALRKLAPQDPGLLAKLIKTYAKYDPHKAQQLSQETPVGDSIESDVDVNALENASWILLGSKYTARKTKAQPQNEGENMLKKRRKRRKKRKTTKELEENRPPPDPERWLPRYERAGLANKKKKDKRAREKEVSRGTQGAIGPQTTTQGEEKPSPTVSSPKPGQPGQSPAGPGPRQQRPAQQKQRKKKGGKW